MCFLLRSRKDVNNVIGINVYLFCDCVICKRCCIKCDRGWGVCCKCINRGLVCLGYGFCV